MHSKFLVFNIIIFSYEMLYHHETIDVLFFCAYSLHEELNNH